MEIKFKTKKKIQRALFLSAPFFLSIIAIILLSVWGFNKFVKNNAFYQIMTGTDTLNADSSGDALERAYVDPADYEALKESLKAENTTAPQEVTTSVVSEYENAPVEYVDIDYYDSGAYSIIQTNEPFPPIFIGEKWATITIPSAQVSKLAVYHGDSADLLDKGAGHDTNSRFPGQGGRIVIPAHVGYKRMFQRLENMKVGDLVYLDTTYAGRYVYEVVQTVIFDENDTTYIKQPIEETGDELICYTCYPYRTSKVRTQRFAIICQLISGILYPEVGS